MRNSGSEAMDTIDDIFIVFQRNILALLEIRFFQKIGFL